MSAKQYTLAVDMATRRPLCVLLQPLYNPSGQRLPYFIDVGAWQINPPKQAALVTGTQQEWVLHCERLMKKGKK